MTSRCIAALLVALTCIVTTTAQDAEDQLTTVDYDLSFLAEHALARDDELAGPARLVNTDSGSRAEYNVTDASRRKLDLADAVEALRSLFLRARVFDAHMAGATAFCRVRAEPREHEAVRALLEQLRRRMEARVHVAVFRAGTSRSAVGSAWGMLNERLVIGSMRPQTLASDTNRDMQPPEKSNIDSVNGVEFESGSEFAIVVAPMADGRLFVQGRLSECMLQEARDVVTQGGLMAQFPAWDARFAPFAAACADPGRIALTLFGTPYEIEISCGLGPMPINRVAADTRLLLCDLSAAHAEFALSPWILESGGRKTMRPASDAHYRSGKSEYLALEMQDLRRKGRLAGDSFRHETVGPLYCATATTEDLNAGEWGVLVDRMRAASTPVWGMFHVRLARVEGGKESAAGEHTFTLLRGQSADWFSAQCVTHVSEYYIGNSTVGTREVMDDTMSFGAQIRLQWDGRRVDLRAGVREPAGPLEQFNTRIDGRDDIVIERQAALVAQTHSRVALAVGQSIRAVTPIESGSLVVTIRRLE